MRHSTRNAMTFWRLTARRRESALGASSVWSGSHERSPTCAAESGWTPMTSSWPSVVATSTCRCRPTWMETMAVQTTLRILRLEDLPGVREARQFRRQCADAMSGVPEDTNGAVWRDQVRADVLHALGCAAAAYRASDWRAAWERLAACEQARSAAMRGLYVLYRGGMVPPDRYDPAAVASAQLRLVLPAVATELRERR